MLVQIVFLRRLMEIDRALKLIKKSSSRKKY